MNAKSHQKTIEKPKADKSKLTYQAHKQPSTFRQSKQPTLKTYQNNKKIPSTEYLNSTIQLILQLTHQIKDFTIAPSMLNSLITSLNLYSDLLKKNLIPNSQNHKIPQINQKPNTPLKSGFQILPKDKKFPNQRRLFTEQQNSVSKIGKISEKQNQMPLSKLKQISNKVLLPQISKEATKKSPQPASVCIEGHTQKKNQQTKNSQTKNSEDLSENDIKSLSKSPKSRFFELKNIDYSAPNDESMQQNEDSKKQNGTNLIKCNPLTKCTNDQKTYEDILDGLKRRLTQHVTLIGKLKCKIKQFESKKLGDLGKKVIKNELTDQLSALNQMKTNLHRKGEPNTDEGLTETQILRNQLQQRQQELKNLWIMLQTYQFAFPSPQK